MANALKEKIQRQEQMTSGGNQCPNSMTSAPTYSV